jgi:starvation-inducible DNA-binding protein
MEELINAMKRLFAVNFQYYTKAHGFHVNTIGPDFTEFHELFSQVYEPAQENIDTIAEKIRVLRGIAPFSIKRISELGDIKDCDTVPKPLEMVQEILDDAQTLLNHYEECHDISVKFKQYGLINFIEGEMDNLGSVMWKLRATLSEV